LSLALLLSTLFPYTTLFRSCRRPKETRESRRRAPMARHVRPPRVYFSSTTAPCASSFFLISSASCLDTPSFTVPGAPSTRSLARSEEHTSELQSRGHLVCRL